MVIKAIFNCLHVSVDSIILDGGWSTREEMRGQLSCHHLQQDLSTVIVVLLRVLSYTESIDVTHVALPIGPQEVKPTHGLLRGETRSIKQINKKQLTLKARHTFFTISFSSLVKTIGYLVSFPLEFLSTVPPNTWSKMIEYRITRMFCDH